MRESTVSVTVAWKGGTVAEARVRDFTFLMDSPPHEKEGGESVGPSATETFLVAYGRCILVSTLKAAKDLGVEIKDISVDVEMKVREVEPGVWRFEEIVPHLKIDTSSDRKMLAKVLQAMPRYCAVGNAIKKELIKGIELETAKK